MDSPSTALHWGGGGGGQLGCCAHDTFFSPTSVACMFVYLLGPPVFQKPGYPKGSVGGISCNHLPTHVMFTCLGLFRAPSLSSFTLFFLFSLSFFSFYALS